MPDASAIDQGQFFILVTTLSSLAATIVGLFFQGWQRRQDQRDAERKRREDLEDRAAAREALSWKLETTEKELTKRTEVARRIMEAKIDDNTQKTLGIAAKVDESTQINRLGWQASNNYDAKVAKLADAYDRVAASIQQADKAVHEAAMVAATTAVTHALSVATESASVMIPDIKQTVEDTNERVRHLEATPPHE